MMPDEPENKNEGLQLISPDTYEYLEQAREDEFPHDELLQEQEEHESAYLFDDDDDEVSSYESSEEDDDSELYSAPSLFDEIDSYDNDDYEEEKPEEEIASEDLISEESEESKMFDEIDELEDKEESEKEYSEPEKEELPEPEIPEPAEEPEKTEETHGPVFVSLDSEQPARNVIGSILDALPTNSHVRYYLSNLEDYVLEDIASTIEQARVALLTDSRDKMFTIPDSSISVIVCTSLEDPMANIQRQIRVAAIMLSEGRNRWDILYVTFDRNQHLDKVVCQEVSQRAFSEWQWKRVQSLADVLIKNRK